MLRSLRPAEWAVLLFLIYTVAFITWRMGAGAVASLRPDLGSRALRILVALLFVSTIHLVRGAGLAWHRVPERHRRLVVALAALCVLPAVGAAVGLAGERAYWTALLASRAEDAIHELTIGFLRVCAYGCPTIVLWAAWVQHLAHHGAWAPRAFVVHGVRDALSNLRDWAPVAFFIPAYSWMAEVIGTPTVEGDAWIAAIDRFLFLGRDPVELAQGLIVRPLTEWLAFSYSFYGVMYPLCLGAALMWGGRRALREGVTVLSVGMALTFVGYTLVPVKGPSLARVFDVPLDYFIIEDIKAAMMDKTRITYDCFPSFHTAGAVLMSWVCARHVRRLFWWTLPMVVSIPFACVYLRYHYVTDVLAGLLLAWVVSRSVPRMLAASEGAPGGPVSL